MRVFLDLCRKRQLGPAKLQDGTDVPRPFFRRKVSFEDDDILRPANHHGSVHRRGIVLIGEVELPHSANIARGEAADVRMRPPNILRGRHRCALCGMHGNQASDLAIQLHLRQLCCHSGIDLREQIAVISIFPDVHRLLLSGAARLILLRKAKENTVPLWPCFPLFCTYYDFSKYCGGTAFTSHTPFTER